MPSLQLRTCSVAGCGEPVRCRGWCLRHYGHYRRHGTPHPRRGSGLPGERWATIPGYEGYYEASDLGRIRSLDRVVPASDGRAQRRSQHVLSIRTSQRYHDVMLAKEGRRRVKVHVMVALAFLGPPPPGHEVNHKNRDRTDNRLVNLEYVTRSQNLRHARLNGGVRNVTKLTPDAVREIRRRGAAGEPAKVIAERFDVGPGCIWDVLSGKTWSFVE